MSIAPSFVTPLRYPGGKARLGAWLAKVVEFNNLKGGTYIEPYAGGAGAGVFLLANNLVDEIIINDLDPAIYSFWWALKHDTENFLSILQNTKITMDTWYTQREVLLACDTSSRTALGFAAFYLNRTNRSGIIKGGVIGGKNQDGKYKIDARFNKDTLTQRILNLSKFKDRIHIKNMDAALLISSTQQRRGAPSLIYLDPPYFNKGSQLYRNHYSPSDHAYIAQITKELTIPWITTYDNCEEIVSLYAETNMVEFSFYYSTHLARPKAKEVMFYGNLELPEPPTMRR
jgi:DNA adenine methylase